MHLTLKHTVFIKMLLTAKYAALIASVAQPMNLSLPTTYSNQHKRMGVLLFFSILLQHCNIRPTVGKISAQTLLFDIFFFKICMVMQK